MCKRVGTLSDCCRDNDIAHCPRCGQPGFAPNSDKSLRCSACGFLYFHNNAAATGVIIWFGDEVLFIERGRDPAKGKLDLPGGFADYDESLEEAAIRETREEVDVHLDTVDYLASFPNRYRYHGVLYHTCDVYFQTRLATRPNATAGDDAARCLWRRPRDLSAEELAFDSVRRMVQLLVAQSSG